MSPHSHRPPKVGLVFAESRVPARARRPSHCGRHVRATNRQLRKGRSRRSRRSRPWGRSVATSAEAGIQDACEPSSTGATHQGMEAGPAGKLLQQSRGKNGELDIVIAAICLGV